ncbi:2-amino-4-hydroxy-6-hydroxymethyldihydropteridine diphosphokinase [Peribacillus cavernae]|uniref:2-amino-4-hydroxy-6-hydroxymethyldihydropteridine diphosphokinase n=1 Tax=Peribacillus cavernae TaxID=1674310 RepID=A0A3S1B2P5_9BACI|nr:2-amino-4-hydroxy-6-hydroxymethyldihydropteridine diphosphokinase [Peribacillus cavernae]MDQ0220874.1 2-amino-4-hydroxy-6-hydroxymethyldihydropteridine diphosphokinase [Peribacillus cavernae]RUQ27308.1 2-amino-4-hydroxy-6-hydroxymethyldihydropteridine diphosphokinase [Peribacillus cavernae]
MENIAYISMGSNIGDRVNFFKKAIQLLNQEAGIRTVGISSLYETDPVGYLEQALFLNAVLKVKTSYGPEELLGKCLKVEQILGRKREIHWGPRTLDLDILLYNHENIETENLSVPHPRMLERAFVIIPLLELDPDIMLPKMETPMHEVLDEIKDKEGVRLWKRKNGADAFALFES